MTRTTMIWILAAWRSQAWLVAPLLVLTGFQAVIGVALPLAFRGVFEALEADPGWSTIRRAILVMGAAGVARFVVYVTLQNLRAYGNHRFEHDLRVRTFGHLLELGPGFYTGHSTGDTLTRLTNDIGPDSRLPWFLCSGIFRALESLAGFALAVVACLWLSPTLTMVCLLPLPFLAVAFVSVSRVVAERSRRVQEAISAVGAELDAGFQGIRLVKAYGAEAERTRSFEAALAERKAAELAMIRAEVGLTSFHEYSWQVVVALVLLVGGRGAIQGWISLGDLMAFNFFAFFLTAPIFELGSFYAKLQQNLAIIERLSEIEAWRPDVADGPGADPAGAPASDELRLEAVGYAYRPERPALSGVSLSIRPGEKLAVVGRVGSGKSTLLRLMVRLVDPSSGTVSRRGHPLPTLTLVEARSDLGYVPQDPVLLSESIRDNVVFGRSGIDEERVGWAVGISRFAQDLPAFARGLDTPVGPRGTRLSGGQKQRLALARALAGRPSLLVMDDCTASLDAATEEAVWRDLARELPDTAIVLVTHRVPVLARADRILVLSPEGRAVELGTHAELATRPGEYRDLYRTGEVA